MLSSHLLSDKVGGAILDSQGVSLFAKAFPHHLALFHCHGNQVRQVSLLSSCLSKASRSRRSWTLWPLSCPHTRGPGQTLSFSHVLLPCPHGLSPASCTPSSSSALLACPPLKSPFGVLEDLL